MAGGLALLAVQAVLATGCSTGRSGGGTSASGALRVVAAENSWGSIAAQLGGNRVSVTSIVSKPETDPHAYEPAPADARSVATARYVIVNGVGYDAWATKLLAAQPDPARRVLNVGELVGVATGGNPHRWYSPPDVMAVINRITDDYRALDPGGAGYFDAQRASFLNSGLADYLRLIGEIKTRFAGTPVGASESIFSPLADALGLSVLTPPGFLQAITQGSDPTASDKSTIDNQIKGRAIKVYVFNRQNSTPDVAAQVLQVRAAGIPVSSITETLIPVGATFQAWQASQLQALEQALAQATGR